MSLTELARLQRIHLQTAGGLVVAAADEVTGGLASSVMKMLTWPCARPYSRRPARNWAGIALRCAARDLGPASLRAVR